MSQVSLFILFSLLLSSQVWARPSSYIELLDYLQEAPDQGETNSCLYVASTGAMELIANKVNGIKNPQPYGPFDLAESFLMSAPEVSQKSFIENEVLKFNKKGGILVKDWPYEAWRKSFINDVWARPANYSKLPRIQLPEVETIKLFKFPDRWSTHVLKESHVELIKESLWKYKSPIIINYNDEHYWHVILIVGYDDHLPGECYDTDPKECEGTVGSFYVRDSFGVKVEVRDYDWFRIKANAAAVVKAKN